MPSQPNMMFNSRNPDNRSILASLTGTGAFRPQHKGVAPPPGSGLPPANPLKTIPPAGSLMTQPLHSVAPASPILESPNAVRLPAPAPKPQLQPQAMNLERLPMPAQQAPTGQPSLQLLPAPVGQGPETTLERLTQKRAPASLDINPGNAVVPPRAAPAEAPAIAGGPARMAEPPSATEAAIARMRSLMQQAPAAAPPPSMNEGKVGLAALPSDAQAAERVAFGMKMPNMTFSGRPTNPYAEQQIGTRSSGQILSDLNGGRQLGKTQTLAQAATDPNYNANGALFQGAKLGVDRNGKAFFREGERPPQFAGGAANAEEARARYIKGLVKMQNETGGRVVRTPDGGRAFVGSGSNLMFPEEVASRMKAGGITPSNLTNDELAANKASMLARLGAKKQQAQQMRAENQRQALIARANQPSPLMQHLMQQDPRLALQFAAMQQQGQLANNQLALQAQGMQANQANQQGMLKFRNDELAARGAEAKANREAAAQGAADQRKFVAGENAARIQAEIDRQNNNPLIGLRKQELEQNAEAGKAAREQRQKQFEASDATARERIKAGVQVEQGKIPQAIAAAKIQQINEDPNLTLEQKNAALNEIAAQQQAGAGGVVPQAAAGGSVLARLQPKSFAGGTLTETQHGQLMDMVNKGAQPADIAAKLKSLGLRDDQITRALNELMPPSGMMGIGQFFGNVTGMYPGFLGTRTADDPGGYINMLKARGAFKPKPGK